MKVMTRFGLMIAEEKQFFWISAQIPIAEKQMWAKSAHSSFWQGVAMVNTELSAAIYGKKQYLFSSFNVWPQLVRTRASESNFTVGCEDRYQSGRALGPSSKFV